MRSPLDNPHHHQPTPQINPHRSLLTVQHRCLRQTQHRFRCSIFAIRLFNNFFLANISTNQTANSSTIASTNFPTNKAAHYTTVTLSFSSTNFPTITNTYHSTDQTTFWNSDRSTITSTTFSTNRSTIASTKFSTIVKSHKCILPSHYWNKPINIYFI